MNPLCKMFALATLSGAIPAAVAGSTVDLTVSGTIIPASCALTLSHSTVDFGRVSADGLNRDNGTRITPNDLGATLAVNCAAPTLYALRGVDNRLGSHHPDSAWYTPPYGLGHTTAGEQTGSHYLDIVPLLSSIDSKPAFVTIGDSGGVTWAAAQRGDTAVHNTGELLGFTDATGVTTGPILIKDALYRLQHYGVIAPTKALTLVDEVALDGYVTIELVYL